MPIRYSLLESVACYRVVVVVIEATALLGTGWTGVFVGAGSDEDEVTLHGGAVNEGHVKPVQAGKQPPYH